jgi:hypothetical protein
MADLQDHIVLDNSEYEILTSDGWKDFKGLIVGKNNNKLKITFSNNKSLVCTPKHKISLSENDYVFADSLQIGDIIFDGIKILSIDSIENDDLVYDFLEIQDVHNYFVNDILSHQCLLIDELAFIQPTSIVEDFWRSVYPTISRAKTSKILITSTPNGVDNLFYKLYNGALKKENRFHCERIDWWEVPGRDEQWKQEQIKDLGSYEAFSQEYGNQFLDNSQQSIDEALFDRLKNECYSPKHILKDGAYKIWEEYDSEKIYAIGGDVSEGVGLDSSVLEIFDITDPRQINQVAEYHNNEIGPSEFTNEIVEICGHWGNPLLLIERNNQGSGVCDRLANEFMYQNLVSWGAKEAHKNKQNGMISHINTKYKAVLNMRYFVNETQSVNFRSLDCLKEFKNFVRYPNGSWKAKAGEHDDRVMATVWMLMSLYNEITEMYFEIKEKDTCDKPLVITPFDMGLHQYKSATSIYTNEEVEKIEKCNLAPMLFGGSGSMMMNDLAELETQGWKIPDNSIYSNPDRNISYEQWDAMEKYFTK